ADVVERGGYSLLRSQLLEDDQRVVERFPRAGEVSFIKQHGAVHLDGGGGAESVSGIGEELLRLGKRRGGLIQLAEPLQRKTFLGLRLRHQQACALAAAFRRGAARRFQSQLEIAERSRGPRFG